MTNLSDNKSDTIVYEKSPDNAWALSSEDGS